MAITFITNYGLILIMETKIFEEMEEEIWKLTKKLNKLLFDFEDEPKLSLEVVDYLNEGGK